jgi:hypothetical protein
MRLYAPLYEGDSVLRPDAALGEAVARFFKAPAPTTDFVRSNIQEEAANETAVDLHSLEQRAHAARSAWIANKLISMHQAVVDWLERNDNFERDNFFAGAANLSDLEQRQRHFERTGVAHY